MLQSGINKTYLRYFKKLRKANEIKDFLDIFLPGESFAYLDDFENYHQFIKMDSKNLWKYRCILKGHYEDYITKNFPLDDMLNFFEDKKRVINRLIEKCNAIQFPYYPVRNRHTAYLFVTMIREKGGISLKARKAICRNTGQCLHYKTHKACNLRLEYVEDALYVECSGDDGVIRLFWFETKEEQTDCILLLKNSINQWRRKAIERTWR